MSWLSEECEGGDHSNKMIKDVITLTRGFNRSHVSVKGVITLTQV